MQVTHQLLRDEAVQRREEGCPAGPVDEIAGRIAALAEDAPQATLAALYDELDALVPDPAPEREEPSDLDAIRALRPDGPRRMNCTLSDDALEERMLGAWLARAAGCTLGKPVEGWTRQDIEHQLRRANDWPLTRYFARNPEPTDGRKWYPNHYPCLRGQIERMARDDDMDYTLLGLHIVETYGPSFTSRHVGKEWLLRLPYAQVYTAEHEAYRNLVMGLYPPETARRRNPYREWIGAQIRADFWGYVAPGRPELAAEFAFRDAAVSHVKNGIYGEMWMAATIAASFATDDVEQAIRIGMSEIPGNCRLARALSDTIAWCRDDGDWGKTRDRIESSFGAYHPVHTINNASLVALGLMYGRKELGPTICIAVAGGWDTDCNGASSGSVLGAMIGASPLPYEWVGPLNDTLDSALSGLNPGRPHRFSDLARRTLAQAKRVADEA